MVNNWPYSQVCVERAIKRAATSGQNARSDDNIESLKKRYSVQCSKLKINYLCRNIILGGCRVRMWVNALAMCFKDVNVDVCIVCEWVELYIYL